MTSQLFSTFIRLVGGVTTLIVIAALLETFAIGTFPKGTYLCLIEFVFGLYCVFHTYRSPFREKRRFADAILCIVLADAGFYFFNYYQPVNLNTEISSLFTSLFYGFGFLVGSIALLKAAQVRIKQDWKKFIVPSLIVLVTFIYYFLPTMRQAFAEKAPVVQYGLQAAVLATNVLISAIGLTVLIYSMNPFLIFISLGFTILPLINFSISSEIFTHGNLVFGFYEYFWAFGIFMAEAALIFLSHHLDIQHNQKLSIVSKNSIGVQYKTAIITAVMLILLGSSVIAGGDISIRIITLGIVVGIVFAVVVSSFTVETVSQYSSILGKYLQKGFTSNEVNPNFLDGLPVELEMLFSSVFAQNMQKERERQNQAAKFNELYQKFAHDVRSPLKAVSNLVAQANFTDPTMKDICLESIRSMNRASQSILDDIELSTGGTSKVSAPAIEIAAIVQRVVRIFESIQLQDTQKMTVTVADHSAFKYVWMDESALERALLNTLNNSAESKNATQILIQITNDQHHVRLEITDNGAGADDHTINLLNQGQPTTTKVDGHGIGLAAHREALLQFEGTIAFESEKDKFFRTLILLKPASNKIILIDDDRAIHLAWATLAKIKEVQIITLGPKDDILQKIAHEKNSHTEIYVDYHFGDRSGVDVLKELKANGFENLSLATSDEVSPEIHAEWNVRDKSFPR